MITEKRLLKISGKAALIGLAVSLLFWFVIFDMGICHAQTQTGYRIPARVDIGGGRMTGDIWMQAGTNGVRLVIGTQTVTQVGTTGVITGTNATSLPRVDFPTSDGSTSVNFTGFNAVYIAGSQVGTSGALSGKLDATGGVGTNNTFNNPTLAGIGTNTATFRANGLDITPAEYASVNNATSELQGQITTATGSITNHTHTGNDGTTQIAHNSITGTGTNSHSTIDTFIASKASASGLASLDGSSLVVQNPTNATNSPTASKIPISLGTGKLDDSWLSSVISKLGTDIQLGTETTGNTNDISEGSTNKYYTDARVTAVIGSSIISDFSDTHNLGTATEGQFAKKVGGVWQGAASSVLTYWSDILGAPHTGTTSNSYFKTNILENNKILIGKPQVLPITATTTSYTSGDFQLINVQSGTKTTDIMPQGTQTGTQLLMRMHGTTTVDSSNNNYAITAVGVIGTTGVTFNTGTFSAYFDGVNDYFTLADGDYLTPSGTNSTTIRLKFQMSTMNNGVFLNQQAGGDGGLWYLKAQSPGIKFYHEDPPGNPVINLQGGSITTNVVQYAEIDVVGSSVYLFLNGNRVAAGTTTQSFGNSTGLCYIGVNSGLGEDFTGYMKDIEILQGVALHTATFTVDETTYYELATMNRQALCSTDGIERITVQSFSTNTAKPVTIFVNGSLTAFGYNSESGMSAPGSSSVYSTESKNAELATNFVVKSKDQKGRNFRRITESYLDKVSNVNLWSWNPVNHKNINRLEAEAIAKEAFIRQREQDWESLHENEYILITTVKGTETIIIRDYVKMERDYKNYIELEWASSLDQIEWIETVKDNLESDTTIRRRGFRYDDPTTPEELKEPGGIGLLEATALSFKAIQELKAIVGSLTVEIETLKNK